jgi:hypothetical protein
MLFNEIFIIETIHRGNDELDGSDNEVIRVLSRYLPEWAEENFV